MNSYLRLKATSLLFLEATKDAFVEFLLLSLFMLVTHGIMYFYFKEILQKFLLDTLLRFVLPSQLRLFFFLSFKIRLIR